MRLKDKVAIVTGGASGSRACQLARSADSVGYDAIVAFISNRLPLRNTAHTIRANFVASATTTVFVCARASSPRSHPPNGVWLFGQCRQRRARTVDQHLA